MQNSTANRSHKKPRFDLSCFSNHKKYCISNKGGKIEANNSITLNTQNLNNSGGVIQNLNTSALNITATQAVTNNANRSD